MDYKNLEKKITNKTKLIVPVPMLGNQWNVENKKIAKKFKLKILEDTQRHLVQNIKINI